MRTIQARDQHWMHLQVDFLNLTPKQIQKYFQRSYPCNPALSFSFSEAQAQKKILVAYNRSKPKSTLGTEV